MKILIQFFIYNIAEFQQKGRFNVMKPCLDSPKLRWNIDLILHPNVKNILYF